MPIIQTYTIDTDCVIFLTGTFDKKIIEGFPTIEEITPSAIAGAFEVKTGTDFTVPNDTYLVGLAKVNNRGQVAPVGSVCALIWLELKVSVLILATRLPHSTT